MKPKRIKLKSVNKKEPVIGSTITSAGFVFTPYEGRACTEEVMMNCPSFEAKEYFQGLYTCRFIECSVCFDIP